MKKIAVITVLLIYFFNPIFSLDIEKSLKNELDSAYKSYMFSLQKNENVEVVTKKLYLYLNLRKCYLETVNVVKKNQKSVSSNRTTTKKIEDKQVKKVINRDSKLKKISDPNRIDYNYAMKILTSINYRKFSSFSNMINDFQFANELKKTGKLDLATKKKLMYNYNQYVDAQIKYPNEHVTKDHPKFDTWVFNANQSFQDCPNNLYSKNGKRLDSLDILNGIIKQESSYYHKKDQKYNVSKYTKKGRNVGAIGFLQVMPFCAIIYGLNPYDPEQNLLSGAKYINYCFQRRQKNVVKGDDKYDYLSKSLASYNGGPNRSAYKTKTWKQCVEGDLLPRESIHYGIIIKTRLNLPLKKHEIKWMVNHGYKYQLERFNYKNELKKYGYA